MLLTSELAELIDKTAHGLARAYRVVGVEFEDIRQEMWEWALSHEQMIERNLDPENPSGSWRVSKALWNAGRRYALAEHAERVGCSVDDFYFYDIPTIESVLPYALGLEPLDSAILAAPAEETRRSNKLPNEGNNFVVMVADVETALLSLPQDAREFLVVACQFTDAPDWDYVGAQFYIKGGSARKRYNRLLRSLQRALGGSNPWAGADRTGTRKVLSNEQARAVTRNQRDGNGGYR